jgi:hypothetical protein
MNMNSEKKSYKTVGWEDGKGAGVSLLTADGTDTVRVKG